MDADGPAALSGSGRSEGRGGAAALVGLDWGTSSCRAYLLDDAGTVLAARTSDGGAMTVSARATAAGVGRARAFEDELLSLCGDWLAEAPSLPVVASGMVGSTQGWVEAAYTTLPVDLLREPMTLTRAPTDVAAVHVVPGLISRAGLPEVVRGEETQLLGVLVDRRARTPVDQHPEDELLVILPGTHTKWVGVSGSVVRSCVTAMTGEVFGLLRSGSILGRLAEPSPDPRWDAFGRGLDVALGPEGRAGVLRTIFSARTLVLTGALAPVDVEDYLSGLLIGHETLGLAATSIGGKVPVVLLCGEPVLCERYSRALARSGVDAVTVTAGTAPRALAHIARVAGLLGGAGERADDGGAELRAREPGCSGT